jgi:ribosomal protein S18 acetylase RimI-like enzyme
MAGRGIRQCQGFTSGKSRQLGGISKRGKMGILLSVNGGYWQAEEMIRHACVDDAADIARIHVKTWQTAYAGIVSAGYLDGLSVKTRTEWWREMLTKDSERVLVAVRGNTIVGWSSFGPCRDDDGFGKMEVFALYVSPEHWAAGIGRSLMNAVEAEIGRVTEVTLWVLERNERARRFYASAGYGADGGKKQITIGSSFLLEIRLKKTIAKRVADSPV